MDNDVQRNRPGFEPEKLSPNQNQEADSDAPGLAVRRPTDRCFHVVEELVEDAVGEVLGYVVDGFMIPVEEVEEVVKLDENGQVMPSCR